MYKKLLLFLVSVFVEICFVYSSTDFKFNFLSANASFVNPDYFILNQFEVQKFNQTYSSLKVNFTTLQILQNWTSTSQIHKFVDNGFKEWLPPINVDICQMLIGDNAKGAAGVALAFLTKMREPLMSIMFKPGQYFPSECPVPKDTYFLDAHVKEDNFPGFMFPQGKWMLTVTCHGNGRTLVKGSASFEVTHRPTQKHRRRG